LSVIGMLVRVLRGLGVPALFGRVGGWVGVRAVRCYDRLFFLRCTRFVQKVSGLEL